MGIFGWNYPAGAEHDPNSPWNQEDPPDIDLEDPVAGEDEECPLCNSVAFWDSDYVGWVCDNCGWAQEAVSDDFKSDEDTPA